MDKLPIVFHVNVSNSSCSSKCDLKPGFPVQRGPVLPSLRCKILNRYNFSIQSLH
ncbi:hypothetical protein MUK42_20687 [Musa troglodytarum]|uniref:Uncharacterized protein n=1 Tax=Musa troglodytarum TaxID=320322 RepID=A0A9E7K780_9LILI|nr:hypothetical protein MUK42_20687 [Musa troglodytarum]